MVTSRMPQWTPLTGAAHEVALEVLIHGPLSRSELARRLDLSAGTVTRLVRPLLDSGMLVEGDTVRPGKFGRPSQPLDVVADAQHFIGVKLTGDEAHAVLTTLRAEIVAWEVMPIRDRTPAVVADAVAGAVARLSAGVDRVTALGVSIGGKTDDHATVVSARYLGWDDVPLAELLIERTGLPTVVENDVAAWTEAEHWFGAGREVESFALVTIGVGVGYGLVVRGRLVSGPDIGVGLIGHIPLDPFGPLCDEGHRGCATAMLSIPAIRGVVSAGLGRLVGYDECFELARAGDPVAGRAVDDAGRALGKLLALIANLTMTEKIIVSGEGVRLVDEAWSAVRAGLAQDRSPLAHEVSVEPRRAAFTEWARGAAVIAIQTYVLGQD